MASDLYDAVIVGARPAGTGMAAFLSKAGYRVLLLDRVTFPKPTLSCPIYFGNTFDILKRLGVLEKVEAIGAPKLRLYQTQLADIRLRGRMLPYRGFDYAHQIRREVFDEVMFKHVAALPNVETRLNFQVTDVLWENGRATGVRGREGGGAEAEIRAEMVVGADGVFSTIAEKVGATKYKVIPGHTCVYYAYYSNVLPAADEPTATIYYDTKDHFAFITANSHDDLTVISISLPASRFKEARQEYEQLHWEYAQKIPEMTARMKEARRETPVYGVSPRESYYRVPYGPGWVLVGDAGYVKDPLPGQGIHDALRSTELAAQAYGEYRAGGATPDAWERAFGKYQRTRDQETHAMYELTDYYAQLEHDRASYELDLFRAIAAQPEWANRYVSMFNGATDVAWFRKPTTVLRILMGWRWGQLMGKFGVRREEGGVRSEERDTLSGGTRGV